MTPYAVRLSSPGHFVMEIADCGILNEDGLALWRGRQLSYGSWDNESHPQQSEEHVVELKVVDKDGHVESNAWIPSLFLNEAKHIQDSLEKYLSRLRHL
ncbi:hypothetical protein VTN77DRAFT_1901 [Rasamsonia byssochlamydoides]|uniref:uncharacterized protein n=1 Tax=Rasamsonia byssochlamydoides TaxID=89139 RepID=UPI00374459DC